MFARHHLFLVGRLFSFSPAGRLSMRWVGPSSASLRLAPVCSRVSGGLLQRASCMSAGLGGAHFLSSFSDILVVPRANHPFSACFSAFPDGDSKVCVCVLCVVCCVLCVCVSHRTCPVAPFLLTGYTFLIAPQAPFPLFFTPVSYTHLTLPTIYSV